jgi:hypothetical protein
MTRGHLQDVRHVDLVGHDPSSVGCFSERRVANSTVTLSIARVMQAWARSTMSDSLMILRPSDGPLAPDRWRTGLEGLCAKTASW